MGPVGCCLADNAIFIQIFRDKLTFDQAVHLPLRDKLIFFNKNWW